MNNYNQVTPWERKKEYYSNIQLGKNVSAQTELIQNQTKELIATQISNTSNLIASQERINELTQQGFSDLSYSISEVANGIIELKAAFEWGISEIVWQIEQNREVLKSIEKGVWSPFDTQARNRKEQALEAYEFGWIDDAEEYFLESEKIVRIDFSVHISLGMIYLFHKIDKEKALSYFEKAVKYSRPKSNYYTSFSLLHKALIHFDMGDLSQAINSVEEAIELSPNISEAYYQNAQYYAQLKNSEKSITNLHKAITMDKNYCLKAHKDSLFEPIRSNVTGLFERIRNEEMNKALQTLKRLKTKHEKLKTIVDSYKKKKYKNVEYRVYQFKKLDEELLQVTKIADRNSYFDFLNLNKINLAEFEENQNAFIKSFKLNISEIIKESINEIPSKIAIYSKTSDYTENLLKVILYGSFIVPILVSLFVFQGASKLWVLIFCVPVLSQIVSIGYIYTLISNYDQLVKGQFLANGDTAMAWIIFVFVIGSIIVYSIAVIGSKMQDNSEIEENNRAIKLKSENHNKTLKELKYISDEIDSL